MIRKLRWKFSAIMMTIVAFLLAVIFITLYYTTKANYVQRSMGWDEFSENVWNIPALPTANMVPPEMVPVPL